MTTTPQFVQRGDTVYNTAFKSVPAPTYDKGYALTSDQTGDSMASGAKAAGSAFTTLVSAIMGNRAQKKAKQQDKIRREVRRKNYLDTVNQSLLNEGEGDRDFDQGLADAKGQLGAMGLGESSTRNELVQNARHANALRVYALRKQRADAKYGWEKAEAVDKLQRQIDRIQQQEAIIGATIDTAVSVASIMSDRRVKRDFGKINPHDILKAIMGLPIATWRYEWEKEGERHLGPMAQDWREKLGFGSLADGTRIDPVDALGVCLVAIQALGDHVIALDRELASVRGKRK